MQQALLEPDCEATGARVACPRDIGGYARLEGLVRQAARDAPVPFLDQPERRIQNGTEIAAADDVETGVTRLPLELAAGIATGVPQEPVVVVVEAGSKRHHHCRAGART